MDEFERQLRGMTVYTQRQKLTNMSIDAILAAADKVVLREIEARAEQRGPWLHVDEIGEILSAPKPRPTLCPPGGPPQQACGGFPSKP